MGLCLTLTLRKFYRGWWKMKGACVEWPTLCVYSNSNWVNVPKGDADTKKSQRQKSVCVASFKTRHIHIWCCSVARVYVARNKISDPRIVFLQFQNAYQSVLTYIIWRETVGHGRGTAIQFADCPQKHPSFSGAMSPLNLLYTKLMLAFARSSPKLWGPISYAMVLPTISDLRDEQLWRSIDRLLLLYKKGQIKVKRNIKKKKVCGCWMCSINCVCVPRIEHSIENRAQSLWWYARDWCRGVRWWK